MAAMLQCFGSPRSQPRKALEEFRVEPIRLRPSVLTRHRDARRVDHMGFDRL
jgi:hypothetical protein